jgi:hypothetical protein
MSDADQYSVTSQDEERNRAAGAIRSVLRRAGCQELRGKGHPRGQHGGFAVYHRRDGAFVRGCVGDPSLDPRTERLRYEMALREAGYQVVLVEDDPYTYLRVRLARASSGQHQPV